MRLLAFLFSFLLFFGFRQISTAQNSAKVDSLIQHLAKAEEDSNKVQTYFQLYNHFAYNDYDQAKQYIDEALNLSKKIGYQRGVILCYDKYGGLENAASKYRKALKSFGTADSLLKLTNWPKEQAIIYGNIAAVYKDMGGYDSAIIWNTKFLEVANAIDNQLFIAFGTGITGAIYQNKGQYNLAARNYMKSLRTYEAIGDESRIADAHLKLGEAHMQGENFEDAKRNLEKAAATYKKTNDLYFLRTTYALLGDVALTQKNFDETESWFDKVHPLAQELDDQFSLAESETSFEGLAFAKDQYSEALIHNKKARKLYQEIEDQYSLAHNLASGAKIYFRQNNFQKALQENKKAEQLFRKIKLPDGLLKCYQNYNNIYEALGQSKNALQAFKNYSIINDSLNNTRTATELEELQLIYDVEKKDQAIELLAKEKELLTASAKVNQLKRQGLTLGLILLGLIAGLIIYSQNVLRKRNQSIAEEKQRRQQLELEKQQLEKQQLERELAAQVLQLCRKNELLTSVKQEVATIAQQDVSVNKSKLQKLERSIDFDIQSDEDWTQFLSTFEKVHPDFLSRLREMVDRLTPAEQRLSCLFKMNLSSKEIATLLNISDEGVKKGRYRLRKKLGIEKEVNLQEFLMNV